jgi:hypothetical protein
MAVRRLQEEKLYYRPLVCLKDGQAAPPWINKKMLLIKVSDEKLREVCPNYGKRMREGKPIVCGQGR